MAAITICSDFGAPQNKVWHCFLIYLPWSDGTSFLNVEFQANFSLSSLTFIKRLFSSSLLSAIRVVSSASLRLLIFLLAIFIPACASSSPVFQYIFLTEMFVLSYVNVSCIYRTLCLQVSSPNVSEPAWQTSMLYSDIVPLIYVNETICMNLLQDSSQSFYGLGWIIWWQDYSKMHLMDKGPGAFLSFKTFLSLADC